MSVSSAIAPPMNHCLTRTLKKSGFYSWSLLFALGCQVRKAIGTVSDLIEWRFAEFAGVPYQSPVSRQQWEELWEMEAER
jgi:hypothetical protein